MTTSSPAPSVLTVSQLNGSVRELLEFNYGRIWLRGEISNLSAPSSGHLYFTLKDDNAQVRAAMFKGARVASRIQQPPSNGQQVLVRAKVSLYAARGDYQLLVEHLEDAGRGALQQAFEMLKARLAAEGLFAADRKRPLPSNPRGVAIVTSATGAAVRDIVQVLQRRAPGLPVSIVPVPVQGADAPAAIVAALQLLTQIYEADFVVPASTLDAPDSETQFSSLSSDDLFASPTTRRLSPFDVVIVARGGGSLEDLWAFNDEAVVRALAAMPVPVVSGVGHEIDFTIADFVVDVRAPTPSAAAELVSPDQGQWRERLRLNEQRLAKVMARVLQTQRVRVSTLRERLRHPGRRLLEQRQRVDDWEFRLRTSLQRLLRARQGTLRALSDRLQGQQPSRRLQSLQMQLQHAQTRLTRAMDDQLGQRRQALGLLAQRAQSVSPLAVLSRGYAIVTSAEALRDEVVDSGATKTKTTLVRRLTDTQVGAAIQIRLVDGIVAAQVTQLHPLTTHSEET